MKTLRWVARMLAVALGMTLSTAAFALPAFVQQFQNVCKPKPGTPLAQAQCKTCHIEPPKLNPFGLDVKAEMARQGSKAFTAAVWKALGPLDSDKDGFSNQAEVDAGTLPGDPNSKPAGASSPAAPAAGEKPETEWTRALHPADAFHPIIVHFPIALFFVSLFFDALAEIRKDRALHIAGVYNFAFPMFRRLA